MRTILQFIPKLFSRLSGGLHKLSLVLCGFFLTSMLIVAGLGVIFRFLLNSSLSWNEEMDSYLFVWLTCLGAAIGYKFRAHPCVEVFVSRFPTMLKKIAFTVSDTIVLILGVILTVSGGETVVLLWDTTASSIPFLSMGYAYAALPAGGVCLIVHAVSFILNNWVKTTEMNESMNQEGEIVWGH